MRAIIWSRVSTEDQDTSNQVAVLTQWAERRDLVVVDTYQVQQSAWKGDQERYLKPIYEAASRREFDVLLVWALDRLSRGGALATLEIIDRLGKSGVRVLSYQETWTEAPGELQEVLLAIAGWVARMESQRRSERTKAGMERVKREGKALGRPPGSRDKKKRSKRGYLLRYSE